MKKLVRISILSLLLGFFIVSNCYPVQLVCIGLETEREGICDIWDVVSIHEDDVDLTGPGYEDFVIIKISNMTQSEFTILTDLIRVDIDRFYNSDGAFVKFWYNKNSNPPDWYEIHLMPKYKFTVEDFTQQDIVTLTDILSTTPEKAEIINKIKDKITLYPQNFLDAVPKQK
jgi:hypothetical protein